MQQKKIIQALANVGFIGVIGIIGLGGLLSACGGGGGSSAGTPTSSGATGSTGASTGTVNMAMTDGPSDSFNHVWVTVTQIAFHTDANAVWSSTDASWQVYPLSAPTTIDLAQLNNGSMNNLFAALKLPVGTYKQVRFFFLSDTDQLSSAAQSTMDNESPSEPLQWNDQVEYVNANGVVAEAPLEIAYPVQGIQLQGTFNVTAGGTLNLATDFDLDKIVVPYRSGSMQAFTMKPDLAYFDLANSGGITGNVATSNLCTTATNVAPATNCAFNLIVHAEAVSADGQRYADVRSTTVNADGTFTLAPLPINDSNGNPINYDIVIRGRQMQTLLVTGVPAAGTYSGISLTGATALQASATPLPVTIATEYASQLQNPLSPLTSGHVIFEQTPALTGGLPHEIRWADTDPLSGKFGRAGLAPWNQDFWLVNSNLNIATYSPTGLSFAASAPTEGTGNYSVIANETVYYDFGSPVQLLTPLPSTNSILFNPGTPVMASGVQSGTVSGTITVGANLGNYTEGEVVLARFAHIISAQSFSYTASTSQNYSFTGVGAMEPGAYYYAYVRLDNCTGVVPGTNPSGGKCSHKYVPISGGIDLRTATSITGQNVSLVNE